MKLGAYLLGSMSLMIQQYADKYRTEDLSETLDELENDRGFPNIETYDFIVGTAMFSSFINGPKITDIVIGIFQLVEELLGA